MSANTLPFQTLDRIASTGSRKTAAGAALLHVAILLAVLYGIHGTHVIPAPGVPRLNLYAPALQPPPSPVAHTEGGGGQKGAAPASKGNPPMPSIEELNPPKLASTIPPKIDVPTTIDLQKDLRMARADVPNLGLPTGLLVTPSLGNGKGTEGIGPGSGPGVGRGDRGNIGNGIRRVGGPVSAPLVLFQPEPEFSDEARKAKVAGNVLVSLIVGADGRPTRIRVLRGIGMGLDEKAAEAAARYKFKPALENGKPVAVEINLEVSFQIF